MIRFLLAGLLPLVIFLMASDHRIQAADDPPVKVFILAGQSNMEGKAKNELLQHQATADVTAEHFARFRQDGKWIVRDDVFIKFLERDGGLSIGFGSPGRTGVELAFGTTLGEHFEEPVLLIKTAWGGHALFRQFRPPSAGMPSSELLQQELTKARQRVAKQNENRQKKLPLPTMDDITSVYGSSYRNMMEEIQTTLANSEDLFPALKDRQLRISGFVWFQGWNDQYGAQDQYAANLRHFIQDIRKDLGAPKLPFVIGVMGQNGSKPAEGAMQTIQQAQLSMEELPEFRGNVKAVRTDVLVDQAAEQLYPHWRERFEEWERTGSDFAYHYLGSAIWFNRIGDAMAKAMLDLMDSK